MNITNRYNLYKAGKITKEMFIYEARKDSAVPFITPLTSFDDAVTMLKQRRIVFENFDAPVQENQDPYEQGKAAHKGRKGYSDNPFSKEYDEEEYDAWSDGWMDAETASAIQHDREQFAKETGTPVDRENIPSGLSGADEKMIGDYEEDRANSEMNSDMMSMYKEEDLNAGQGKYGIVKQPENELAIGTRFYSQQAAYDYIRKFGYMLGDKNDLRVIELGPQSANEGLSLREQVQDFVKKAMEGGSSMDEAKEQAREYFSTEEAAFGEGKDSEHSKKADKALDASLSKFTKNVYKNTPQDKIPDRHKAAMKELNEAVAKLKLNADQVNPYELKKGIECEMGYSDKPAPSWAEASLMDIAGDYQKAQAKALKNLNKDPMYYTRLQANGGKKEKKVTEKKVQSDGYLKAKAPKIVKEGIKTSVGKIREYVSAQLKKEAQLVKSATTGATIDIIPDAQAIQMKADLQKKGVKTVTTKV